ncbi:MAG TPA: protease HtpX, partial [Oligoflexia bacterium]|nr:protease HtpX [Oligoflexia bacterium]
MLTHMRRYFLFFVVNIGIVLTISLVLNLLGVSPYIEARGLNMESLAIYCLIWGMAGAFISLAISRIMAKMMMGVKVIDPMTRDSELQWLVSTTHDFAKAAGLRKMPEVGIYESPELNAFATGPTKNRALVAVSTGLLRRMNRSEIEGVLAHEVSHISNGDMVTMTLIQGIMNAFVMFLARLIAFALTQNMKDESRPMARM